MEMPWYASWLIFLAIFAIIVGAVAGVARWLGASRFLAFALPVFPLVLWLVYCVVTGVAAVGHGGASPFDRGPS